MKQNKIIGVLGGMGPQASVELYRLLIEGAKVRYGAQNNDDYPEILIDSVPIISVVDEVVSEVSKRHTDYRLPVNSSLSVLAESLLKRYYQERKRGI